MSLCELDDQMAHNVKIELIHHLQHCFGGLLGNKRAMPFGTFFFRDLILCLCVSTFLLHSLVTAAGKLVPRFLQHQALHKVLGRPERSHCPWRGICHVLSRCLQWKSLAVVSCVDIFCKNTEILTQNDLQSEVLI